MDSTQASPVPPPGTKPRLSDCGWLIAYGMRGTYELVRARLSFAGLKASDIPARNRSAAGAARPGAQHSSEIITARVGYVLPRISARLPWRSDCLIQAMAAQDWLASKGLASEIRIGVARSEGAGFEAHAWLVHAEQVITGGAVDRYHVMLREYAVAAPATCESAGPDQRI
jgi:hypothetical protein